MGNRSTSSKVKVKENLTESCLIWLDASVNSSTENVNAQKQFRRSFKNLLTFDDEDCLRHIHSLSKRDRIILIVTDVIAQLKDLFTHCRIDRSSARSNRFEEEPKEIEVSKDFEFTYSPEISIDWYRKNTFLYRKLNSTLRVQDVELLYLFRFFIRDTSKQLEQNRCRSTVRVFRGQFMSKKEVEMLEKSIGEFVSISSFYSTSINREVAQKFLNED
ncbi:unnamed protein product [Rotaria magnacalcarata]|uniref:Uncharacterized protein n=1 Tax=Rotaria magnacalcarata TaxID=392030 RepID=A0A8S2WLK0_9BILA|nr:unnamed protein product [Rotaria magnacalcarata]